MWYFSGLGGRGTIPLPIDANPDGKITYREVPIEIICAAESPIVARPQKPADTDSLPETYYHVNMMTSGGGDGGSDDGEIDAEIEREREALEEQRDMYRGDNIDGLLPEEPLGQDEDDEGEENASDENGVDSTEEDNNVVSDSAHDESTDDESDDDANSDENDTATAIAAQIAIITTPDLVPPAIPPKVSDNSNYAGLPGSLPGSSHILISAQGLPVEQDEDVIGDQFEGDGVHEGDQNLSVSQYIKRIYLNQKWHHHQARIMWQQHHKPNQPFPEASPCTVYKPEEWERDDHVIVPQHYDHLLGAPFDLQQMNWYKRMGITPLEARRTRDSLYQNYQELKNSNANNYPPCGETMTGSCFEPQAMHTKHQASTPHFQLRNHFAVQDHLRYIYSSGRQVWSEYNWSSSRMKIMDFSEQSTFGNPVTISTLALSTDQPRSISMIGGLNGEFAYKSLLGDNDALNSREPSSGHITTATSGCINHIDIDYFSNRQSHHAIISCNDFKLRTLDLTTGLFLHNPSKPSSKDGTLTGHPFPFAINSSATCPDGRLRVLVGDSSSSLIVNAQTGKIETKLTGHTDYIFACAWSPDARHVVTAGQDRVVKIYDARTWRVVRTFSSHVSCHRSVRFSPVGGGPRCLLLAEEADRVTVVDARTFAEGQTHEFYGGVVGCDFEGDGNAFWVANGDGTFGGFMRFERTGKGQRRGLGFTERRRAGEEEGPDEWIAEEEREGDPRCVNPRRHSDIGGWMT